MSGFALPSLYPARTASDYWELLKNYVPSDIVDSASWDRLANAAPALPGAAFGFERTLDSPAISQFGFHLWPWCMDAALACAANMPRAAFLAPLIRAWRTTCQDCLPLHLMIMWDEQIGTGSAQPQVFLTFAPNQPNWQAVVREFAGQLDDADLAQAWQRAATAPHANIVGLGVYLGRQDMPVRATVAIGPERDWNGHPNWAAVDEIASLSAVPPLVAVPPTLDPGLTWHVPVVARMHAKPHEALAPLVGTLLERGMVDADTALMLQQPPLMIPVPGGATFDGQPALLRLMVSLERIKIVVADGAWLSAKICYMVRPVWRSSSGRVFVES
ncbi:hypothetical protein [Methylovulum psychrotolerans]|uniref:Uncharacterized protein n=1 Tax=Methylovulum psychrotolerans TaxID=1704499 RepID=A0A1Z4BZI3_9GAMM|nr:hypothetical protein [Methylovulum psychrotolerans]ASF46659.1 hypothetical protein CEK71_11575 [Methylovulum psychrotolerans]